MVLRVPVEIINATITDVATVQPDAILPDLEIGIVEIFLTQIWFGRCSL